jgi:hypothetical protein
MAIAGTTTIIITTDIVWRSGLCRPGRQVVRGLETRRSCVSKQTFATNDPP